MKKAGRLLSAVTAAALFLVSVSVIGVSAAAKKQRYELSSAKVTVKYPSYTYSGKAVTPDKRNGNDEITAVLDGKILVKGRDYTVSYTDNVNVGIASAKLTGIGKYTGRVTKTFVIKPARNAILSADAEVTGKDRARITVNYRRGTEGTVGYQVLYSKNRSRLEAAAGEVKNSNADLYVHSTSPGADKTWVNLSSLPKPGETWYIKVRSYYTKDGRTSSVRYGNYSAVREVKVPELPSEVCLPTVNINQRGYYTQYASSTRLNGWICAYYGCGPTALTMVLYSEKGMTGLTKDDVLKTGWSYGLYFSGTTYLYQGVSFGQGGMSLEQLRKLAGFYGNTAVKEIPSAYELIPRLKAILAGGHRVMLGHYSPGGFNHYTVVYGYTKDGNFLISDPQLGRMIWSESSLLYCYGSARADVRGIVYYG